MQIIGDKTLEKELKVLMKLTGTNSNNTSPHNGPIDDWEIKK
jgi:hypothetical protein